MKTMNKLIKTKEQPTEDFVFIIILFAYVCICNFTFNYIHCCVLTARCKIIKVKMKDEKIKN